MKIEHLKYNSSTLPESIYKYFCSLGNQRSFSVVNGKTTFYDLLPPFNRSFLFKENGTEYNCFILEKYYELFNNSLSRGDIKDENGIVLNEKTIYEFLVSYAKGFTKGYNDFKETISKTDLFEISNTDLAYNIFERVYPSFTKAKDGNITVIKGDLHNKKLKQYITNELFYEAGYEGGEYFKAWELILKSPMLFKEFFDKISPLLKALPPHQTNIENLENKFCQSMPMSIPKEHFNIFTIRLSKNGKSFLTNEQFDLFIERAFNGNDSIPKQRFNQSPKGEKLLIQSVFYEFYDTYCFDYFTTMQCQETFIKLLTDNFEGWDYKNVKDNFKPKTEKRL